MDTQAEILSKLYDLKPFLRKEFNVVKIGLFGSFADNTNTENSDIDILIEIDKPIGWRFFSLELYLEKIFNKKIDIVTQKALKAQIRDHILQNVKFV